MRLLAPALMIASLTALVSAQTTSTAGVPLDSERPLSLPLVHANAPCPVSLGSSWPLKPDYVFGGPWWFGDGPIHVNFAWGSVEQARFSLTFVPVAGSARRAKTPWVAAPGYAGPVEIRGRSLGAEGRPLLFTQGMSRTPADRLRLHAPNAPDPGLYSFWASGMFVPGPGCYGIQIDTLQHTQVVVFEAL